MGDLRKGFTTGSCAAAAAKAATYMLLTGGIKEKISIETPKGIVFNADILNINKKWDSVKCGVVKDGGDDPDVTTGLIIYAEVSMNDKMGVEISGGEGIGVVTKPGLDQEIGMHAINSVPRAMIEKEVTEVLDYLDPGFGVKVTITCPGGEEVAQKTFNPRLGIEGGISILGTSGIVEPMSDEAIIDTIKVELRQKKAEGYKKISVSPGSYGLDYMKTEYGFDLERSIKCSNFIGKTWDILSDLEFEKVLFVGHAGKLVKIGGGIMNTHSREADSRMEIISATALKEGVRPELCSALLDSNTTDVAFGMLRDENPELMRKVGDRIVEKILYYLNKRTGGKVITECVMFSKDLGLLGKSAGADEIIEEML